MNDITAIAVFLGCVLATLGLVRLCDRLSPGHGRGRTPQEAEGRP
jgi:hypothetical protein